MTLLLLLRPNGESLSHAQSQLNTPFNVHNAANQSLYTPFTVYLSASKPLNFKFHVYSPAKSSLKIPFHIIASITDKQFLSSDYDLPRPGQWVYVKSDRYGVPSLTLCKVTSVNIRLVKADLYEITVEINRIPQTTDVLMARLSRRQSDLIEDSEEILETLALSEKIKKEEFVDFKVYLNTESYSGNNYSNNEFSGA